MKFQFWAGFILFFPIFLWSQPGNCKKIEYAPDRFLQTEPNIIKFSGSRAVMQFETVVPTPPVTVYFGALLGDDGSGGLMYRRRAIEKFPEGISRTCLHQINIDVSRLESPLYDTGLVEERGGTVMYRIELYDPRISASRFHQGKFRYKRVPENKREKYRKVVAITAGPFVDLVTHESAVISWETDEMSKGTVLINDQPVTDEKEDYYHEITITGLKPQTEYTYQVSIADEMELSPVYIVRTAPAPGNQDSFRFGFMSDSRAGYGGGERNMHGVNYRTLSAFTLSLYNKGCAFICFGGDLVNGYTSNRSSFELQLRTWKMAVQPVGASLPIYEGMGNHELLGEYFKVPDPEQPDAFMLLFRDGEGDQSTEACFAKEFVNPSGSAYGFAPPEPETKTEKTGGRPTDPSYKENVYSFHYGNMHIIILNTNYWYTGLSSARGYSRRYADKEGNNYALRHLGGNREGYLRRNQLHWLQQDLEEAQKDQNIDVIMIVLHEPTFPNGGHALDAMFWGKPGNAQKGGYNDHNAPLGDVIDMRNRFWKLVSGHQKVVAVLAGDEHNYSRTLIDSEVHPEYQYPVWQITSGGCGAPFYTQDTSVPWIDKVVSFSASNNYCLFEVKGGIVNLEGCNDRGEIIDQASDLNSIKKNDK